MCQELWFDAPHGSDLWRMLTESVRVVTPAIYYPSLPCLEGMDGCDGDCDFCMVSQDEMHTAKVPWFINTLPAFHELLPQWPRKHLEIGRRRPTHRPVGWDPLDTEIGHCGLFVVLDQPSDEAYDGQHGQTHVPPDLIVSDDCLNLDVTGVDPHWCIPVSDLDDHLRRRIEQDQAFVESQTDLVIKNRAIELLWEIQDLGSTKEMGALFDDRKYAWRAFLREVGDECATEQSR